MKEVIRTCTVCGRKKVKDKLNRYVLRNNLPVADRLATMSGRGAYCCKDEQCIRRFLKEKKKWNKAFRIKIRNSDLLV